MINGRTEGLTNGKKERCLEFDKDFKVLGKHFGIQNIGVSRFNLVFIGASGYATLKKK